jgi:two-component system, sensor histidine kinase and response regulator
MLNTLGYEPIIVENGKKAVEAVADACFDIILMDVQMPEMDGFEASGQIRKLPGKQPVIIAVTANAMQGDEAECRKAGMDDYVSKPIKIDILENLLVKWARQLSFKSAG